MKKILIAAALLSLFGCTSQAEKEVHDKTSMQSPRYIGTLPNGQKLNRIELIDTPDGETHYVYYTDNVVTTNLNVTHSDGRTQTTHQLVYVRINGQDVPLDEVKRAVRQAEAPL